MFDEICVHEDCTGCSACFSVCPKGCICMVTDREGFLRPVIDKTQCIECGKCRSVCPVNREWKDDGKVLAAYAGVNKNIDIRIRSSSGGLFSAFAEAVLKTGGAVVGAGFDEDFSVMHKVCTDVNALEEMRRSKYAQSRIGTAYQDVKTLLDAGKNVLFCGTPCQVGGLLTFLGKEYHNLYTVDFICHGVPSPAVWERYIGFRKEKAQAEITDVSFRSKETGWKCYSLHIDFADDSVYSAKVSDDLYLRSFLMDMNLRPSCYQCQFKQIHRQSDITLADLWGAECMVKDWNDDKGVSLVLIHSAGGQRLMELCSDNTEIVPVSLETAIANNPSITKSVSRPALRDAFMSDVNRIPFDKLHEKYCGNNLGARIRRKIAALMK